MADSPFIRDVPAARALTAWRDAREAAGCPDRLPAALVPVDEAAGLVTAGPVWAVRSSPPFDAAGMDGIAVRAADTLGASETTPVDLPPDAYDVVDTGDRMRAADVAAAAAAGATHLLVRRRPVVAILPTGDEVRPIGEQTGAGEITDTNSLMLATQAREAGCEAHCLPIEPDDPERIAAAVRAAVTGCDLLIFVAGS